MFLRLLPLITALAPLVGVNAAYWIGVNSDVLPSCNPYFDGCASISSTGRYPPGDRLFRAVMLPQAVLLAVTWHFAVLWLKSLRPNTKAGGTILGFGLFGAVALIVYVSYLASNDPFYEFMRRFGIYFYFIGTVIAQLTLTFALKGFKCYKPMLWVMATPFVLGLANFVQKMVLVNPDRLENVIEWVVSLLMQLWFVLLYLAWRQTGLTVAVSASGRD